MRLLACPRCRRCRCFSCGRLTSACCVALRSGIPLDRSDSGRSLAGLAPQPVTFSSLRSSPAGSHHCRLLAALLCRSYYRGSHGIIIVYDVTEQKYATAPTQLRFSHHCFAANPFVNAEGSSARLKSNSANSAACSNLPCHSVNSPCFSTANRAVHSAPLRTFENVKIWLDEIEKHAGQSVCKVPQPQPAGQLLLAACPPSFLAFLCPSSCVLAAASDHRLTAVETSLMVECCPLHGRRSCWWATRAISRKVEWSRSSKGR